jgi:hypothetical protein
MQHVTSLGQCFGGFETYEKTTGMAMTEGDPQGLLHQPGTAVTRDCTAVCRQSTTCKAFTVGKIMSYLTYICQRDMDDGVESFTSGMNSGNLFRRL